MALTTNAGPPREVRYMGDGVWRIGCHSCRVDNEISESQWRGRVAIRCRGCMYNEAHDLSGRHPKPVEALAPTGG